MTEVQNSGAALVRRVRHELELRELEAAGIDTMSPGFDDHVKRLFDGAGGRQVRRDHTPRRMRVSAYWKQGVADHHEDLA